MKSNMLILSLILLVFGCNKATDEIIVKENIATEPYIKSLILPDTGAPSEKSNYIHVNFKNSETSIIKELTFSQENQSMSVWPIPSDVGLGMSIQGVNFSDQKTKESLEISFYFNTKSDTTFNICYADYFFADPWRNIAGANIIYKKPVSDSVDNYHYYLYLGVSSNTNFFKITYIGTNRINGIFQTKWQECCGEKTTYDVYGDFSIPDIRYFQK